ncbi:MAG TPA: hypothetical protein VFD25_04515, partial [Clostridia bacterium]|nr:hypothetical protein [Clostridia bacterium]
MVYRVYVEKKQGFNNEAKQLLEEFNNLLSIKSLTDLRIINRYDVENIDLELLEDAKKNVFSEPQVDNVYDELSFSKKDRIFAVEYLPGQFDQRASSAAE